MRWVLFLCALGLFLSLAMAGAWVIARRPGRSSWTDVFWSFAVGIAGVCAALAPIGGGRGSRRWLVVALIAGWSLRLGTHLLGRAVKGRDDPRYAELKRRWGQDFERRLFWFLQIQAGAGLALMPALIFAARNPAPFPAWSDLAAALLLLLAILGETIADRELKAFGSDPANKGKVNDRGLWGLSRHPNYFFEWLGWLAYPLIAIGPAADLSLGWLALSAPLFIYWLLVRVSGIPPTEEHMLRSRGDKFRDYQRRVNGFFPGFARR